MSKKNQLEEYSMKRICLKFALTLVVIAMAGQAVAGERSDVPRQGAIQACAD